MPFDKIKIKTSFIDQCDYIELCFFQIKEGTEKKKSNLLLKRNGLIWQILPFETDPVVFWVVALMPKNLLTLLRATEERLRKKRLKKFHKKEKTFTVFPRNRVFKIPLFSIPVRCTVTFSFKFFLSNRVRKIFNKYLHFL